MQYTLQLDAEQIGELVSKEGTGVEYGGIDVVLELDIQDPDDLLEIGLSLQQEGHALIEEWYDHHQAQEQGDDDR